MLSNALTTGVNGRIMAVLRGDADDRRFLAAGLPAILGRLPTLEVAARCTVNNLQRHSASDPPGSPGGSAQRQDPARKLQGHLIVPVLERISLIAARHPATWGCRFTTAGLAIDECLALLSGPPGPDGCPTTWLRMWQMTRQQR
jgi:hypothetical protein